MANTDGEPKRKRKRRWGDAPPDAAPPDAKAKALALKESVAARLAAMKAKKAAKRPAPPAPEPPKAKKAKTYDIDMEVTGPTYKPEVPIIQKPKINPYLAHQHEAEGVVEEDAAAVDYSLARASKPRQRHKELNFIEPGKFVEIAERKRQKAANALQSGFVSGRKAGTFVQSTGMAEIYGASGAALEIDDGMLAPRADCGDPENMPLVMEWWDTEFLPSKLRKQVQAQESEALAKKNRKKLKQFNDKSTKEDREKENGGDNNMQEIAVSCYEQAALSYSKTAALVQHIVPIGKPKQDEQKQPTLYLTKKELKRQRKRRREAKQQELRDMQVAGLIPAAEPKLTLQNFIRVLGDQAYLDPSQTETKVKEQIQARQKAHLDRNEANKLTKEQRAEKQARKLAEDTTDSVSVAIFYVKDMSHTYHRTKVDLNAQQNNITGGVLECQHPQLACVICEGGPKAIKRYTRLMTVRMKWQGPDDAPDEDDEEEEEEEEGKPPKQKFNPDNTCSLVWTGMGRRRLFKHFMFQTCESSDVARKVLANKGVGHYWDQVISHASGRGETFHLKLADDDDEDEQMQDAS